MTESHVLLRDKQTRSKERMTILAWLRDYRWSTSWPSDQGEIIDSVIEEIERGEHLRFEPVAEMLMDLERLPMDSDQTTETLAATVSSYASRNIAEFLNHYPGLGAQLANAARLGRIPLSAIRALQAETQKRFPDNRHGMWAGRVYARLRRRIVEELVSRAFHGRKTAEPYTDACEQEVREWEASGA